MSGIAIVGISKIKRKNIKPSLDMLQKMVFDPIGIQRDSWDILGSTGKKPESGDIDIAMNIDKALCETGLPNEFEYAQRIVDVCAQLKWQVNNRMNTGFKMVHIGLPIVGQSDEIAQVDIMSSNNIEYSKFKYYSPSPVESKYNGAIRSMLLDCILRYGTLSAADDATEEDRQQYTSPDGRIYSYIKFQHLSLSPYGLIKNIKTLRGKRGMLATPKSIRVKRLSTDPTEILNIVFGKDTFNLSDFNSFESIWNNVLMSEKFLYKDKITDIVLGFVRYMKNNNSYQLEHNKLAIPDEAIIYCQQNSVAIEN